VPAPVPTTWRVVAAAFETSAPDLARCPPADRPEIAFAGRSNVGKSSLLNVVARQVGLARVSRTPGRTQLLNCFRFELRRGDPPERLELRLVDLPGYGFARAHRSIRESFGGMIEGFLEGRPTLRAVAVLADARRGLDDRDRELIAYLRAIRRPPLVVVTKADKLGKAERGLLPRQWAQELGVPLRDVLVTSAAERFGIEDGPRGGLVGAIAQVCAGLGAAPVVDSPASDADP
jgi:GTP-binding protein